MLSDCKPCREAGAICRTDPEGAKKLHEKCNTTQCICHHVIPEERHEYVTSRVDG